MKYAGDALIHHIGIKEYEKGSNEAVLHLRNINITSKFAEAKYSPENSGWWGHISVDIRKRQIASVEVNPEYGESYRGHAFWKLLDMADDHDLKSECTVMWY